MSLIFLISLIVVITVILVVILTEKSSTLQNLYVAGNFNGETFFKNKGNDSKTGSILSGIGGDEGFLAKYNTNGMVDWAAKQTGTGNDVIYSTVTDNKNNIYIGGAYTSPTCAFFNQSKYGNIGGVLSRNGTFGDSFLAKYNDSGFVQWAAKQSGDTGSAQVYGITSDNKNNIYTGGYFNSNNVYFYNQGYEGSVGTSLIGNGTFEGYLAKYNSSGDVQWAARQSSTQSEIIQGINTDNQNKVYITGIYSIQGCSFYNEGVTGTIGASLPPSIGNFASFLAKYDEQGKVEWAARQDGSGNDEQGVAVSNDTENNVYIVGDYGSNGVSFFNKGFDGDFVTKLTSYTGKTGFLAKYNDEGNVVWAASQNAKDFLKQNFIHVDNNNNLYISGYYGNTGCSFHNKGTSGSIGATLPGNATINGFLTKYTDSGEVVWAARQSSSGSDITYGITSDNKDNVYITGIFAGTNGGISFFDSGQSDIASFTLRQLGDSTNSTFTAKYTNEGKFVWASLIGGKNASQTNAGRSITISK